MGKIESTEWREPAILANRSSELTKLLSCDSRSALLAIREPAHVKKYDLMSQSHAKMTIHGLLLIFKLRSAGQDC